MRKTPLNEWHRGTGATMTDFNGWDMPLYYKGITEEHLHTRQSVGMFDLCHMGRIWLEGAGARAFVDRLTPAKVREAKTRDVQYSFLLNEKGQTIDDITVYYEDVNVLLVVNAGNKDRALEWIQKQAQGAADVAVVDASDTWGMIAVQGPRSLEVMKGFLGANFEAPGYYQFKRYDLPFGVPCLISGTGYTGEAGFEIYMHSETCGQFWDGLMEAGAPVDVRPIGLGARDSLRLEASMPLYGHELTDDTTPLSAGLGKFLDLEKPEFVGREALHAVKAAGGPPRKLVGFELKQRGPVARQGFAVCAADESVIGEVTSGIFSPTLQKVVGMAYVDAAQAVTGSDVLIDIRGRKIPATIIKRPFYKRSA